LIFAKADHIKQIIEGSKTQTRRSSNRYRVCQTYAIQPGRTKPGIKVGRILITECRVEHRGQTISAEDALAEGSYTPSQYEDLYEQMYPGWETRYVYVFKFLPEVEQLYDCGAPYGHPPYPECCTLVHGSVCQEQLHPQEEVVER